MLAEQVRRQQETPQVGRLLLLYIDESVDDATPFGDVRQRAFKIMSKEARQIAGQHLSMKPPSKLTLRWEVVDGLAGRIRRHLRPLYGVLEFSGVVADNPWLKALAWVNAVFANRQRLSQLDRATLIRQNAALAELAVSRVIPRLEAKETAVVDAGSRFVARGGSWKPTPALEREILRAALGESKCERL